MVPAYMSPNATVLPCPVHTKGTSIGFLAGVGIHVLTEVGLVSCHVGAVSAYVRASCWAPPHAHRTVRVRRGLPGRETTHLGTIPYPLKATLLYVTNNSYCYLYYLANIILHFDKWRPENKIKFIYMQLSMDLCHISLSFSLSLSRLKCRHFLNGKVTKILIVFCFSIKSIFHFCCNAIFPFTLCIPTYLYFSFISWIFTNIAHTFMITKTLHCIIGILYIDTPFSQNSPPITDNQLA